MPSAPGKSKWKERIAEVLKQQGGLTERQIMGAIEHDTQHTRGVLRNMLKAGIVRRERGENNAFSYVLESNVDIAATRIPDFSKLRQRCTAIKNLFLAQEEVNPCPQLTEDEIMRSFGQHPRGVREALRVLQSNNWLVQKDGRYQCSEVSQKERAAVQSIMQLQSSATDWSEASTDESACNSPAAGSGAFFGSGGSGKLDALLSRAGEVLEY